MSMTFGPDVSNPATYKEWMDELMQYLEKCRGTALFENLMRLRADNISREMCNVLDKGATDFLRGQLSICYELADGASMASKAAEAKAKADAEGESQSETDDE